MRIHAQDSYRRATVLPRWERLLGLYARACISVSYLLRDLGLTQLVETVKMNIKQEWSLGSPENPPLISDERSSFSAHSSLSDNAHL